MLQSIENKVKCFIAQPLKKMNKRSIFLTTKYARKKTDCKNSNQVTTNNILNDFHTNLFFENMHVEKRNNDFAREENNPMLMLTQAWWND
jgi:5-methylthioribose kinase